MSLGNSTIPIIPLVPFFFKCGSHCAVRSSHVFTQFLGCLEVRASEPFLYTSVGGGRSAMLLIRLLTLYLVSPFVVSQTIAG